ncbi:MAG: flagellin [Pseudomonadota bacterium]
MSSILTNNSAMVALQTLKGINKNLAMTQNEISTGKSIATAKDDSALWSIAQTMQSDVDGFAAISGSLALGSSTVAVARDASESITTLLGDIKEKIVAAQEENVDRDKIQSDIEALRGQVVSIFNAAQFNGQNLLQNTSATSGSGTMQVLSSLDRDSNQVVSSRDITVQKQDLGTGDSTAGTTASTDYTATAAGTPAADGGTGSYTLALGTGVTEVAALTSFELDLSSFDTASVTSTASVQYVAREGDTLVDVAAGLAAAANFTLAGEGNTDIVLSAASGTAAGSAVITVTNNSGDAVAAALANADITITSDGNIGGGLELLGDIDVSTSNGASAALSAIEYLTQRSIDAAAEFGSIQGRLEIQADFISRLSDNLKSGIGALVDADMEEASARLQALQVQQQLGIQSLSIANQAPQNILSLFR